MIDKSRKGMAMVSVLFALTVFMLFGTLILTSALNANSTFRLAAKRAEICNTLDEIGDEFVLQATNPQGTTDEDKCTILQTALTEKYKDKLSYVYQVTAESSADGRTTYTLHVKTAVGTDEAGNATYAINLVVAVCDGKVTKFSYVE